MAKGLLRNILLRLRAETKMRKIKPENVDSIPAPERNPDKAITLNDILPKKYPLKNIRTIVSELYVLNNINLTHQQFYFVKRK